MRRALAVPYEEVEAVAAALGAWREIRDLVGERVTVSLDLKAGGPYRLTDQSMHYGSAIELQVMPDEEDAPQFLALIDRLDDVRVTRSEGTWHLVGFWRGARARARVGAALTDSDARAFALFAHVAALVAAETARTPESASAA